MCRVLCLLCILRQEVFLQQHLFLANCRLPCGRDFFDAVVWAATCNVKHWRFLVNRCRHIMILNSAEDCVVLGATGPEEVSQMLVRQPLQLLFCSSDYRWQCSLASAAADSSLLDPWDIPRFTLTEEKQLYWYTVVLTSCPRLLGLLPFLRGISRHQSILQLAPPTPWRSSLLNIASFSIGL